MIPPLTIKFMSETALFTNFTNQEFIGYWDGKPRKFAPGQSMYLPDSLAQHYAATLTNRELLRTDSNGTLIYKDGEKMTSPKKPEEVPLYMELFNKAYAPVEDKTPEKKSDLDTEIDVLNRNKTKELSDKEKKQDPKKPQVILPPDFDEDDDESSFEGKPKEPVEKEDN